MYVCARTPTTAYMIAKLFPLIIYLFVNSKAISDYFFRKYIILLILMIFSRILAAVTSELPYDKELRILVMSLTRICKREREYGREKM